MAAFPFGPEMVYEAAASYVSTEETLYAVLHLPLLSEAFIYYVQQDFPLILPSGPIFLRSKDEAYLPVTEDNRYYLLLTVQELASCHVLGATRVCAGAVLWTRWTDGCLPASAATWSKLKIARIFVKICNYYIKFSKNSQLGL